MILPLVGEVSLLVLGGAFCCVWTCCQCLAAMYASRRPWPTFHGSVVSVGSVAQWSSLLENAAADNRLVLVDCFAYWCPPCKAAAYIYAQMSLEYDDVCFAKVDVDAASDVARLLGVSAMPTFFLFGCEATESAYRCLDECVGWSESRVRRLLESRGVQRRAVNATASQQGHGPGEEKRSLISSQA